MWLMKQAIPCNTAMDKSSAKVMDAALSDTNDCLASLGDLLNTWLVNLWQYSSFSSNRWGLLDTLCFFNSRFQSKAHLFNDSANTTNKTAFSSNTKWPLTSGAIPVATIFRNKGIVSTAFSSTWSNWDRICCCKFDLVWPSQRERAANWFNISITKRGSIIQSQKSSLPLCDYRYSINELWTKDTAYFVTSSWNSARGSWIASYPGSFPRAERGNEPGDKARSWKLHLATQLVLNDVIIRAAIVRWIRDLHYGALASLAVA